MGLRPDVRVDTAAGPVQTLSGGAERIKLCAALVLGGLTPSAGGQAMTAGALKGLGTTQVQASCSTGEGVTGKAVNLGFGETLQRRTDADKLRALRQAIAQEQGK